MDQERTTNHILRDLIAMGLIDPERSGEIRPYIMASWMAGWEDSRQHSFGHSKKQIGQYNKEGKLIAMYSSTLEAAKKTGYTPDGIYKALIRGEATKQRWIWKYMHQINRVS